MLYQIFESLNKKYMYFLFWIGEAILFSFVFAYRIIFASRIFDFRLNHSDPIDICSLFNEYILRELILLTFFTFTVVIIPFRSIILFLLNILFVLRGWIRYSQKKLLFSPFQLVRDATGRRKICVVYIIFYTIDSLILIYKLLIVSILTQN